MNKVILLGNLGADPELRYTNSGVAVLNIRLATTERFKDKQSGEWRDKTEWHDVVLWQARAEAMAKMLHKGSKVLIEGSLQTRSWEDRQGNKRYKTEVAAQNIELCDRREGGAQPQAAQPQDGPDPFGAGDEDIPF